MNNEFEFKVLAENNAGWSVCSYMGCIELYDSDNNSVYEFDSVLDAMSSIHTAGMTWRA